MIDTFGGLQLDLFIFSVLATACVKGNAWPRALALLQQSLHEAVGGAEHVGFELGHH